MITPSPGLTPSANNASIIASVPFEQPIECLDPENKESSFSNNFIGINSKVLLYLWI